MFEVKNIPRILAFWLVYIPVCLANGGYPISRPRWFLEWLDGNEVNENGR